MYNRSNDTLQIDCFLNSFQKQMKWVSLRVSQCKVLDQGILDQGIFCPSIGAKFWLLSQSKIATFFPIPCLFFPIKKSKKKKNFFFEATATYEKQ